MQEPQETQVWSMGLEDPLEKGMVTHSSILVWRIAWTQEPGGQSIGSQSRRQPKWLSTHTRMPRYKAGFVTTTFHVERLRHWEMRWNAHWWSPLGIKIRIAFFPIHYFGRNPPSHMHYRNGWSFLQRNHPPQKEKSHMFNPLSNLPLIWAQPRFSSLELPDPLSITEGRICLEGCVFAFSAPSFHGDVLYLFEMIILNGCGAKVRPYFPVRIGFESLGKTNMKLCIRLTNIRNSSIFASCSPIHTRFPKNKTRKKGLQDHPFSYLKRDTFIRKL